MNKVVLDPDTLFPIVVCAKHLPTDAEVVDEVEAPCSPCRREQRKSHMREELIFDEDYTGPRYVYGCTHRPPAIGCQPDGRIIGADRPRDCPDPRVLFGTISYPRPLTQAEVEGYELLPLLKDND